MSLSRKTAVQTTRQRGFSLIEVMFASVILAIGLLSLLALFAQAISASRYGREDLVARQKAREALENVYAARNDTSVVFNDIQNVSNGGIFKDGFQSLYLAGANGIAGTGQDSTTLDSIVLPGSDGVVGTADDVTVPLVNYRRQILISNLTNADGSTNTDMRRIVVTVRVLSPGRGNRDMVVSGVISRFP